jgi:hypothetical protein
VRGQRYYVCDACGVTYAESSWAEQCEAYCTQYNACSLSITSHAVHVDEDE